MSPWALITPSSRGIGLAVTRHVLQTTKCPVVATARKDLDKTRDAVLNGLDVDKSRLTVLRVDVTNESTIEAAASHCASAFPKQDNRLHLAFALPGLLFPEKSPQQVSAADALLTYQTNALGPLLLMKHFSPFLPTKRTPLPSAADIADEVYAGLPPSHAVWATFSARVGSISDNNLGGWYSYRSSKAAVNQLTKTFDNHLRTASGEKAIAVALHPGTVKTNLSKEFWGSVKEEKLFEPEWVAERLIGLVTGRNISDVKPIGVEGRGQCWDWKGDEIPP
ncbi:NAD(P)-binding protein [Rhizodiscina lignyota]|uniref:NAD(P)-binding protein n=1 Tax=Rhizodiscina lignyota TaxID=1504668 RepID=A0A9P4IAQ9_9PEZI|nr:NAD(P)-binding protein [Rhizodiscina lignyota]